MQPQPYSPYPPPYAYRPEKDYLGEAFLTLLLYYIGLGIVGLIANIIFLNNARRDQSMGILTHNVGCLQVLLWFHIIGMVIGCLVACVIFLIIPLLGAGMGYEYGY